MAQRGLKEIGGKGLFIKELEVPCWKAVRISLYIRSKTCPRFCRRGFALPFIGFREDVRDVLLGCPGGLIISVFKVEAAGAPA